MEKTLSEALQEYELVSMPSRNWAAKTRINYRNDIADLIRFLEKQGKTDPNWVGLQDLEAYMAKLDRRGYTGTTRVMNTCPLAVSHPSRSARPKAGRVTGSSGTSMSSPSS